MQNSINQPDFFGRPAEQTQPILDKLNQIQVELERAYLRWDELESALE
jgi:ATP-binding cassette subfamily F protein uup